MFEWFLYISLALGAWLVYEIVADKVHGPGRYWITINVEGDADRVEYLIRRLAKEQKIKIRNYKISAEKPDENKHQKLKKLTEVLKKLKPKKPRPRKEETDKQETEEPVDPNLDLEEIDIDEIEIEKDF